MRNVRAGCISKYNFDDIKYFCEVPFEKRSRKREIKTIELQKKLNYSFGWVLSESTLDKIEKQCF